MIVWMISIPLIFLWGFTLFDVFARKDHGWVAKVLWAMAIVFLPLIGMLVYVIARPKDVDSMPGTSASWDGYMPGPTTYAPASGPTSNAVRDLESITRLHDSGTLSDTEYQRLKDQLLAA